MKNISFITLVLVIFFSSINSRIVANDLSHDIPKMYNHHEEAKKLLEKLRCLVCQGQNIAESNSLFALDIKNVVNEKLKEGSTAEEIISYLTQQYGNAILIQAPLSRLTWMLWCLPFLIALVTFALLLFYLKFSYFNNLSHNYLSDEENKKLDKIVEKV